MDELWSILRTMDVPQARIGDDSWHNLGWLRRYLVLRNGQHEQYWKAMELIMAEIDRRVHPTVSAHALRTRHAGATPGG